MSKPVSATDKGRFVWYENLTTNPAASIDFYSSVMGWSTQPFEQNKQYTMWVGSQGPLGGVMELPNEAKAMGMRPHWMAHVMVDNVDATVGQVRAKGGKVLKAHEDIPTVGRFSVIADPQGASLSLFTPQQPMELHDPFKPGDFCWSELMTTDSAAAFQFYSQLFGWKIIQEMEMGHIGTYRVFGLEKDTGMGGMMNIPQGAHFPPMWIYYTEVADLDSAIGRAKAKGGNLMNGPMDVPGGGRIAQLTDPQGAMFALHQAPRK